MWRAMAVGLGALLLGPACGGPSPANPFGAGGDATGGGAGEGGGATGGATSVDPTLGGPCVDDEQCDDELDCTFDECDDELSLCRFTPDDSQCQNGVYCDGLEVCHQKLGCQLGAPVSCSDGDPCTIDTCVEATETCKIEPRDADLDGDPDIHCGGGDCDDLDPTVSSLTPEICDNAADDDCDGDVDESPCAAPANDTCLDPLEIQASGTYSMSSVGAQFHYATSCPPIPSTSPDVVAALIVPPGPAIDIKVTARTESAAVSATLAEACGDPFTELTCSGPFDRPGGGKVAKLRGRALGGGVSEVAYPLYVTTAVGSAVTLEVDYLPAAPPPANETCGTAAPLTEGAPVTAEIIDAANDVATTCGHATGDLIYTFTLTETSDIDLYAVSLDGDGLPSISLRTSACALPEDEIACHTAPVAHVFRHSLPAGSYAVAVAATAPTDVSLVLEVSPPTPAPPDEECSTAQPLAHNVSIDLPMGKYQDDHDVGCFTSGADAAFALDLAVPSDVLLVERFSTGDSAGVALSLPACADPSDLLACGLGQPSPIRASDRNVPPGSYRVIAESLESLPLELTALVRPAVPTTLVPFSFGCDDALTIPPTGGFFQGTTANATADFTAGCDLGGQPPGGAGDQLLRLVLASPRRVVLDMMGSTYMTLLNVREGPTCPGTEVPLGCAVGFAPSRSFLDLDLDAGTYFIQIDGYSGAAGPWFLDVRVVAP